MRTADCLCSQDPRPRMIPPGLDASHPHVQALPGMPRELLVTLPRSGAIRASGVLGPGITTTTAHLTNRSLPRNRAITRLIAARREYRSVELAAVTVCFPSFPGIVRPAASLNARLSKTRAITRACRETARLPDAAGKVGDTVAGLAASSDGTCAKDRSRALAYAAALAAVLRVGLRVAARSTAIATVRPARSTACPSGTRCAAIQTTTRATGTGRASGSASSVPPDTSSATVTGTAASRAATRAAASSRATSLLNAYLRDAGQARVALIVRQARAVFSAGRASHPISPVFAATTRRSDNEATQGERQNGNKAHLDPPWPQGFHGHANSARRVTSLSACFEVLP